MSLKLIIVLIIIFDNERFRKLDFRMNLIFLVFHNKTTPFQYYFNIILHRSEAGRRLRPNQRDTTVIEQSTRLPSYQIQRRKEIERSIQSFNKRPLSKFVTSL